eukprot:GAHX01000077.1.p1 GENE.GAHX01000077.1~~GAHX01000077.1.p1  ORF type:complete len:202 (+),score=37.58 GAHX01000077.1:66-671(+)
MPGCCRTRPITRYVKTIGNLLEDSQHSTVSSKDGFKERSIKSLIPENGYLVLWGFPKAFTFICPTEVENFNTLYSSFKSNKCEVACFSTDSVNALKGWFDASRDVNGIKGISENLLFIGDRNGKLSKSLGVLNNESGDTDRATFIIDSNLKVRYVSVIDDSVGRQVDGILRTVASIKKSDETGKLCPASWDETKEMLNMDK